MKNSKIRNAFTVGIFFGFIITCVLAALMFSFTFGFYAFDNLKSTDMIISQEAANEICFKITNEPNVIGSTERDKFICTIPAPEIPHPEEEIVQINDERPHYIVPSCSKQGQVEVCYYG